MMKTIREEVIKRLLKRDINNDALFGDQIADLSFPESKMALLINDSTHSCSIFHSASVSFSECFLHLTEVIGIINFLEKEGLIIISNEGGMSGVELYYESKDDFHETQIPGEYLICDNQRLVLDNNTISSINGENCLNGVPIPKTLYSSIVHVICGRIYPTKGLEEYYKRGCRTLEQHNAFLSRVIAWIAIIVSIVLGLLSLWLKK